MAIWTINLYTTRGPRNRTNCQGQWGTRNVSVIAENEADAIKKAIEKVGYSNYGGLVENPKIDRADLAIQVWGCQRR